MESVATHLINCLFYENHKESGTSRQKSGKTGSMKKGIFLLKSVMLIPMYYVKVNSKALFWAYAPTRVPKTNHLQL